MAIYFGIDPGKSGSVSAIWDDGTPWEGSPCKLDGTGKDIADWFHQFDLHRARAVLEKVHAGVFGAIGKDKRSMGVVSAFSFGQSYGHIQGILDANEVPYVFVTPQEWMKSYGIGTASKCASRTEWKNKLKAEAQRRWPFLKITHANADSLLIAEWARTQGWRANV